MPLNGLSQGVERAGVPGVERVRQEGVFRFEGFRVRFVADRRDGQIVEVLQRLQPGGEFLGEFVADRQVKEPDHSLEILRLAFALAPTVFV